MSKIIIHRGIACLNTIPNELVWGIANTVLECANCLYYASEPKTNVLIGICMNCASIYNGVYGCGYFINLQGYTNDDIPTAFGGITTNEAINILSNLLYDNNGIPNSLPILIENGIHNNITKQTHINSKDVFSIYNLALLSKNDLNLLSKQNNYSWINFKNYYNCSNNEELYSILDTITMLKHEYELENEQERAKILFNECFYKECVKIEKRLKYNIYMNHVNQTQTQTPSGSNSIVPIDAIDSNKYYCNYCKIYKNKKGLKNCGGCKQVKYCSISCQTRDWKLNHNKICTYNHVHEDTHEHTYENTHEYDYIDNYNILIESDFIDENDVNGVNGDNAENNVD